MSIAGRRISIALATALAGLVVSACGTTPTGDASPHADRRTASPHVDSHLIRLSQLPSGFVQGPALALPGTACKRALPRQTGHEAVLYVSDRGPKHGYVQDEVWLFPSAAAARKSVTRTLAGRLFFCIDNATNDLWTSSVIMAMSGSLAQIRLEGRAFFIVVAGGDGPGGGPNRALFRLAERAQIDNLLAAS